MAATWRFGLWAEVGDAGCRRHSIGTTYMVTSEAINTAMMYQETTSSVPLPAVERKNKKSSFSCKETKMNRVHSYWLKFRPCGLVPLTHSL
jgi:hypothetical protein